MNDSMYIVVPSFAAQYGFNPGVLSSLGTLGGIIGLMLMASLTADLFGT